VKKYFGDIKTLLIVVLGVIIFLMRSCQGGSDITEPKVIVKTEVKFDTITKEIPKYIPKVVTRIVNTIDTVTLDVDTAQILQDYFATYVYTDFQELDSLKLQITDSVSQNKILNRSIKYDLIYPTRTITRTEYINQREFYYGVGIGGKSDQLNYVGGELMMRNKKGQAYSLGLGVNQDFQPILTGRYLWKIGK